MYTLEQLASHWYWVEIILADTVDGGHRAVMFHRFGGGILDRVYGEGTHFRIPFIQQVYDFDVRIRHNTIATHTGTKDMQMVNISMRVLSRLVPMIIVILSSENYSPKKQNSAVAVSAWGVVMTRHPLCWLLSLQTRPRKDERYLSRGRDGFWRPCLSLDRTRSSQGRRGTESHASFKNSLFSRLYRHNQCWLLQGQYNADHLLTMREKVSRDIRDQLESRAQEFNIKIEGQSCTLPTLLHCMLIVSTFCNCCSSIVLS